ncbi:28S ribosomal protein S18b, mitochondrial [Aplysia californica]|uniref:Small ribosomal subunit protein mS40 n=1 Tax=Aplysia californica TaxID=6500 RepID=A0ABM0K549_APLCA|nr:28S ribosomal protein S18b, mitochondrial [Aplysia californica]
MAASIPMINTIMKRILILGSKHNTGQCRTTNLTWCRTLMQSQRRYQEESEAQENSEEDLTPKRKIVDPETSIRYVHSPEFVKGYGDKPVWFHYRRNFKGKIPPPTRENCIRQGEIATASPCPICRDEYLVLDAKNIKLLEQFICPHSGEIFDSMKTGLCQTQQKALTVSVMRAQDQGLLEMKLPFRTYDYEDYKS